MITESRLKEIEEFAAKLKEFASTDIDKPSIIARGFGNALEEFLIALREEREAREYAENLLPIEMAFTLYSNNTALAIKKWACVPKENRRSLKQFIEARQ